MAASIACGASSLISFGAARFQVGRVSNCQSTQRGYANSADLVGGEFAAIAKGRAMEISKGRTRSRKVIAPVIAIHAEEKGSPTGNWDSLPGSPNAPNSNTKGWTDTSSVQLQNPRLIAQLRTIALAARDRGEMHTTIALQRDNWNKLCHTTVVTTTVVAALVAAINGATNAPTLTLTAFLLNAGTAGLMFLAGKMQPSQLAEEQRSAARQCKSMADEIESTLQIDPRLREHAHLYIEDKLSRLQAVDMAYPLPLVPNGLPKFPEVVTPTVVNTQVNPSEPEMPANNSNGWSEAIAEDLKRTGEKSPCSWGGRMSCLWCTPETIQPGRCSRMGTKICQSPAAEVYILLGRRTYYNPAYELKQEPLDLYK